MSNWKSWSNDFLSRVEAERDRVGAELSSDLAAAQSRIEEERTRGKLENERIRREFEEEKTRESFTLPDPLSFWFWLKWGPLIILIILLCKIYFWLNSSIPHREYKRRSHYYD